MADTRDITFRASTDGRRLRAHLALPDRPAGAAPLPGPAVLVIHEAMGLNDDTRRIAGDLRRQRLHGARAGPRRRRVQAAVHRAVHAGDREGGHGTAVPRADAPSTSGSPGIRTSTRTGSASPGSAPAAGSRSCTPPGVAARSGPSPRSTAPCRGTGPCSATCAPPSRRTAGATAMFGKLGEELEEALDAAGIPNDVKTYPDAGHSFMSRHDGLLGAIEPAHADARRVPAGGRRGRLGTGPRLLRATPRGHRLTKTLPERVHAADTMRVHPEGSWWTTLSRSRSPASGRVPAWRDGRRSSCRPATPAGRSTAPSSRPASPRGPDRRLTILTAGAGFGKSTLASRVARAEGAAWYTIDASDRAPGAVRRGGHRRAPARAAGPARGPGHADRHRCRSQGRRRGGPSRPGRGHAGRGRPPRDARGRPAAGARRLPRARRRGRTVAVHRGARPVRARGPAPRPRVPRRPAVRRRAAARPGRGGGPRRGVARVQRHGDRLARRLAPPRGRDPAQVHQGRRNQDLRRDQRLARGGPADDRGPARRTGRRPPGRPGPPPAPRGPAVRVPRRGGHRRDAAGRARRPRAGRALRPVLGPAARGGRRRRRHADPRRPGASRAVPPAARRRPGLVRPPRPDPRVRAGQPVARSCRDGGAPPPGRPMDGGAGPPRRRARAARPVGRPGADRRVPRPPRAGDGPGRQHPAGDRGRRDAARRDPHGARRPGVRRGVHGPRRLAQRDRVVHALRGRQRAAGPADRVAPRPGPRAARRLRPGAGDLRPRRALGRRAGRGGDAVRLDRLRPLPPGRRGRERRCVRPFAGARVGGRATPGPCAPPTPPKA